MNHPQRKPEKFDGLAGGYDVYRPRYPAALFAAVSWLVPPRANLRILDLGAGTGIALEGLLPIYGQTSQYIAADISSDMVAVGQEKFPFVDWNTSAAEPFLEAANDIDLLVFAQALQWMDRPRVYAAAQRAIRAGGAIAVLQNNRDYSRSAFLDRYETLLEEMSPNYRRNYRDFDFQGELRASFAGLGCVHAFISTSGVVKMPVDDFINMSSSSTQVQRAVAAHGDSYFKRLRDLAQAFADDSGRLDITYESQLIAARR